MTTLLQISDPHFGTVQPEVLEALVRMARAQRPDLLVLSGDITQRARVEELLRVIGVKTTRRWRHKNGEVSSAQIERVVAELRQSDPAQLRIVVVHQPVYVPSASDRHDRLRGWEPAVRAWAEAGADIVMGGHIHLPYVHDLSSSMAGLGRRLWCVQAGTSLSTRLRAGVPNSVNLLRYGGVGQPASCLLERWDYQAVSGQFECANATVLLLDK